MQEKSNKQKIKLREKRRDKRRKLLPIRAKRGLSLKDSGNSKRCNSKNFAEGS